MEYQKITLSNGIRVVLSQVNSPIAHAGLFINAGSRDEEQNEHGIAHLIEHVIFKGTQKRRSHHILSRLEDVGGELNAFTTKEETCIHATFMKEYLERALELIADIAFNSVFPEKELNKEIEVVIDEINSYKDNPSDLIFDDFDERLFPNDPLGRNILGKAEKLKKYNRENLLTFIKNNYHTDQMVISVVGNVTIKQVEKLALRYFCNFSTNIRNKKRAQALIGSPFNNTQKKSTYQTHCIIGTEAYSFAHPARMSMHLLNNMLGGPGMNSRLSMSLRERNGYTYNIESNYANFSDTGIFSVYFGTDKENLDKCIKLIFKEFDKLREQKLSDIQLSKAKKQLIGQLAIASESNENIMLSMGKSFLVYDKFDNLEEVCRQIESINANDVIETANEILNPEKLSFLIYSDK
jgi:predicted Zn-dependent peptidase